MRKSSRGNPYHDEWGRFTTADGCRTKSELSSRGYEQRTIERQQASYDFTDEEVVKNYLTEQFEANGYKPVEIKTSEGWVYVEPYCYGSEPSMDKVEYYNVEGPVSWMGGESLDDVCRQIAGVSESVQEYYKSKSDLSDFYDKNIANATEEEMSFSHQLSNKVMDDWSNSGYKDSYYDYFEKHRSEYVKHFNKSEDEIQKAWNLNCDLDTYSDWHKDIYGFRPR